MSLSSSIPSPIWVLHFKKLQSSSKKLLAIYLSRTKLKRIRLSAIITSGLQLFSFWLISCRGRSYCLFFIDKKLKFCTSFVLNLKIQKIHKFKMILQRLTRYLYLFWDKSTRWSFSFKEMLHLKMKKLFWKISPSTYRAKYSTLEIFSMR